MASSFLDKSPTGEYNPLTQRSYPSHQLNPGRQQFFSRGAVVLLRAFFLPACDARAPVL